MKVVVCDVDGTIADMAHRIHLVDCPKEKQDWNSFLHPANVEQDPPITGARKGLEAFLDLGAEIRFLTGRKEALREVTTQWIKLHMGEDIWTASTLTMRKDDDFRKATIYKGEHVENMWNSSSDPGKTFYFFDDDPYLWEIYKRYGVVFKAPEAWGSLFPSRPVLPEEVAMRK